MEKQLKVAHVITRLIIGGAQENTLSTVLFLMEKNDYNVSLITGPGLGPEGSLEQKALDNKVNMILISQLRRNINPIRDITAFFQLFFIFRKNKYDIIHTHSSKAGIIGRLAGKLAGCRIIIHTIHGLPYHPYEKKWKNSLYIFLEKFCAKISAKIFTVSNTMRDKALSAGVGNKSQYITVYSGMDINKFIDCGKHRQTMRKKLDIKPDELVIGKIARLFELKGHDFIIDCAKEIIKAAPNSKFLFVGNGNLRKNLVDKTRQLKISDHFIFTGLVPPDKIPNYISCMDILVHASLREGLARALPQAFAAGIPVVTLDIDSANEIVINNQNGYLVQPGDKQNFIKSVVTLLKNNSLRKSFGQEGKKNVLPIFSGKYMTDQIDKIYKDLI
ncbi:glycosyltransferase family 4 protein [bacterium]|nr:glycosyltransferase family 4 protein [bacterium]